MNLTPYAHIFVLLAFLLNTIGPVGNAQAQDFYLPAPGAMVSLSSVYVPVLIKGLKVHPENPLLFDFILDTGKSGLKVNSPEFKIESEKLIKYFLASLTIKQDDLWVNLSPYEKNRIIPQELGQTELGADMLGEDYILKQLTASLIYPEKKLGKDFWNRIYTKAQQMFGTANVPVNTFNKVWIIADRAKVLECNNVAYVVGSHLKVMLEEDYMALEKHTAIGYVGNTGNRTHAISSQIVREIIIPELEKEVNQGKNFATLRQIFYSMILASWYKRALKNALLNQVYSNREKTVGVLSDDPAFKEKIYEQYLRAYKKGVFNYIKEDTDQTTQQTVPRRYFSGGIRLLSRPSQIEYSLHGDEAIRPEGTMAMVTAHMNSAKKVMKSTWETIKRAHSRIKAAENKLYSYKLDLQLFCLAGFAAAAGVNLSHFSDNNLLTNLVYANLFMTMTTMVSFWKLRLNQYNTMSKPQKRVFVNTYKGLYRINQTLTIATIAVSILGAFHMTGAVDHSIFQWLSIAEGINHNFKNLINGRNAWLGDATGSIRKRWVRSQGGTLGGELKLMEERLGVAKNEKAHKAMGVLSDASKNVGGIDMNDKNMDFEIAKKGHGIEMKFDPAMIAKFQQGDFLGIIPIIDHITSIQNPLSLLESETGRHLP